MSAVVERYDGDLRVGTVGKDLLGEPTLHLFDLILDVVDNLHRVAAVARHNNATYRLLTFLVEASTAVGRSKADLCHILDTHRHAVARCYRSILKVGEFLHIAQTTDEVFGLVDFHGASSDINVGVFHGLHDLNKVQTIRAHGIGIEVYLILFDEATDRGHLGHALSRRETVAHVIVLDCAELLRIPSTRRLTRLRVSSFKCVPIDLSEGCGIGTECGPNTIGQQTSRQ